ncbi:hypothetical protein IQ03_03895 [Gemmobacter caeni]|uniref:Uncharacterized protein n=1 Tax=Gemmobacter caeni TaxID=589035 RepID=A0A2T6B9B5_9RHOB|nr:hypothetical protein [Gemmobacter caeni]PTX52649.1 hypothetical protein C8N34_102467 [Gemmobacter caeni]TWI94896.1 hypothetical protein IQ03_03895 [Gemmobacter caeni]
MDLARQINPDFVVDPFAATPRHGADAPWVVRDMLDEGRLLRGPIPHYDAMRVLLTEPGHLVIRADQDPNLVVTGRSFASNHMSASPVDATPALSLLEMQDFVDLLEEEFGPGPVSSRILGILDQQGDPRAQRLVLYTSLWSSPDENGKRPEARLQISKDDLMGWLEARRPEIYEELNYRMSPPGPSITD